MNNPIPMCHGIGNGETHTLILDDGRDNPHPMRTYEMHLVFGGHVMCGRSKALHTVPARGIKHPITLSLGQTEHRQRKLLEGRCMCPDCWAALRKHIERVWHQHG
ncbi:hypothetical protein SuNHUV7_22290 (plasmid) [Pseudoseohaeicola sp. NH-UV-7]|uniref:hypothetical protein n=1 Tax=Sulfitobacter sp. TBRI5 TaxID=2989732 RepID=UPI003A750320